MTYLVRHTLYRHVKDELVASFSRDELRKFVLGDTEKLFCECGTELIGFKRQKKDICEFCEQVEDMQKKFAKAPTTWKGRT